MSDVYGEHLLRDPDPALLARKKIVPLSRFNDRDIRSMDFGSWRSTESAYEWGTDEREHMARLVDDIERNGLRKKIVVMQRGPELYVANGHHRVIALKKHLGWTHIPYQWFSWSRPQRFRRDLLPTVPRETEEST